MWVCVCGGRRVNRRQRCARLQSTSRLFPACPVDSFEQGSPLSPSGLLPSGDRAPHTAGASFYLPQVQAEGGI